MLKIKNYPSPEHNPLYSRKVLDFKRFNFWWARLSRMDTGLYQRHISRNYKRHRFLFNRFKKINSFNRWIKPVYAFSLMNKPAKEKIDSFSLRKETCSFINPTTPSVKKIMELGFHVGGPNFFYTPKVKRYLFGSRSRGRVQILDIGSMLNSYKSSFFFSRELKKRKGVFHFVSTRSNERNRETFRPYNRIYARRAASFNTSKKWLGGTLTNLTQLTLQRNIEDHPNIDPFEFFQSIFYTRKRKKKTDYKIPDSTVLFDGFSEFFGRKDSVTRGIPSIISTSNSVNPDLSCYSIYASHSTNTILHVNNKIFLKALQMSKFSDINSITTSKKKIIRYIRKIKKINFKKEQKRRFVFFKCIRRRRFRRKLFRSKNVSIRRRSRSKFFAK